MAFYANNGWDIVGQTLDPEATLARQSGCHYGALAATIDDHKLRSRFMARDSSARNAIDENIGIGRERMWDIFLKSLPTISRMGDAECGCSGHGDHFQERSRHFYCRPPSFFE